MNDHRRVVPPQQTGIVPYIRRTLWRAALAIAVILLGLLFAKHTLAIVFQPWDDEGYVLLSLASYMGGSPLYTETYSQYGPFYFYAQEAWFRLLRLSISHDSGRLITLFYWAVSAFLGGGLVYTISRNILLGSAASLACILLFSVLANEPGHPQQVVLLLLMLSSCSSLWGGSARNGLCLFLLGAVAAALLFTKINVGVFYLAALAHTLFCLLSLSRLRTVGLGVMLAYAVAAPLLLMHSDLLGWARGYSLVAVLCGSATFVCGALLTPSSPQSLRGALYAVAGMFSATALILVPSLLQGTSSATLVQGVLLEPLKHPGVFVRPLEIGTLGFLRSVLVVGCIGTMWVFRDRLGHSDWVGALRCLAGLLAIFLLLRAAPRVDLVLAFLPLGLMPITGRVVQLSDLFPRLFIADLAATQFLQAYPVAGSQLNIAAAPLLLWAFVCISDGVDGLHSLLGRASRFFVSLFPPDAITTGAALTIILALSAGMLRSGVRPPGHPYPPSNLRGSTSLHLPPDQEDRYGFLAGSIRANCDVLFTMPGMGSFNLWSGVPAPNGSNLTAWMKVLSPERQEQILAILQSNPHACVVYNRELVQFWQSTTEDLATLPLASYIIFDMPKIAERGGYEIRIHPKRTSPWIRRELATNTAMMQGSLI